MSPKVAEAHLPIHHAAEVAQPLLPIDQHPGVNVIKLFFFVIDTLALSSSVCPLKLFTDKPNICGKGYKQILRIAPLKSISQTLGLAENALQGQALLLT